VNDGRHGSDGQVSLDPRESQLAELLSQLTDRVAAGDVIDLETEISRHPDFSGDLRQLWGAVMMADAMGSQAGSARTMDSDQATTDVAPLELPYRLGDYELLDEVGRGGMGVVYRAHQLSLNREVAVKMLLRGQWASADDQRRFRHEAEAAARLNHSAIVPVYEVAEHEGRLFFSMEYVKGETLAVRLERGPLESDEAASILACVAEGVQSAHDSGILHRDIKPSNILIDAEGIARITDFGLARRLAGPASLTRTGAILGTPAYMSPEQAAGSRGQISAATDIYSMGSVLYHMLTGYPPFEADTPVHVVLQVLEQDPPLPRMVNPKVDRDLEMIALRCLQKPTDLRYPSAAALAADLNAYLKDEPISARSGRFSHIVARLLRETHHATILQNWGLLWMWHSLVLLVVCLLTNGLQLSGVENRWSYFLLWTVGLGTWALVFWALRQRMGPVTFIERQIAHIWAASMASIAILFPVENLMDFPVLTLSPVLGLSSGMVFLIKAGMLSGTFYIQAVALFVTTLAMATWPRYAHAIFGFVSAGCFFFPGWKYYHDRRRVQRAETFPQ
jgi:serine/threonine protein kinase